MRRYRGGESVGSGTYWDLSSGEVVRIPKEGGMLPKATEAGYWKVPLAALVLLGPFAGLVFVIFLPLAVVGAVVPALIQRLVGVVRETT